MSTPYICCDCIGESYLKEKVMAGNTRRNCMHCRKRQPGIALKALAALIHQAFEQHYYQASTEPDYYQQAALDMGIPFRPEGQPVVRAIEKAAGIPQAVAAKIRGLLEDQHYDMDDSLCTGSTPYEEDAYYVNNPHDSAALEFEWQAFEEELKTRVRFFNQKGIGLLERVFKDIDQMITHDGHSVIVKAGPGAPLTSLYRARVFQNWEKLKSALANPDRQLGTPPSSIASSGRMNAKGIPVFYGALQKDTAIAEVRPPVGSWVAVACFDVIEPLRLLDLSAVVSLQEKGSIFDATYAERLLRARFLQSLSLRLTEPVMPDEVETDYLVTQGIADYLATGKTIQLDGILFPSSQTGTWPASNVVLFNKSAKVRPLHFAEGKGFAVEDPAFIGLDEAPTDLLIHTAELLAENDVEETASIFGDEEEHYRTKPKLAIDVQTVEVIQIKGIAYSTAALRIKWEP